MHVVASLLFDAPSLPGNFVVALYLIQVAFRKKNNKMHPDGPVGERLSLQKDTNIRLSVDLVSVLLDHS